MSLSERLAIIVSADTRGAVKGIEALGRTAERDLGRANRTAEGFGARMDRMGDRALVAGAAMTTFGAVASASMFNVARQAAQLGDSMQAADQIFGKQLGPSIDRFARDAAKNLGLSRQEATDTLNAFATLGAGAGLDNSQLLQFSQDLTKVAADVSSLTGRTKEDVLGAFTSGLAGEIEPLRRIGINITAEMKRIEAARLGLRQDSDRSALTPRENVLATSSLIQNSKLAQAALGDFQRTIDSLPNQLKIAQANFDNLKVELGTGMIPAFTSLAEGATSVINAFNAMPAPIKSAVGQLAAFGALGSLIGGPLVSVFGVASKAIGKAAESGGRAAGVLKGLGAAVAPLGPLGIAAGAGLAAATPAILAWSDANARASAAVEKLTEDIMALDDAAGVSQALASNLANILDTVGRGDNRGQEIFAKTQLSIDAVTQKLSSAPGAFDSFLNQTTNAFENLGSMFDGATQLASGLATLDSEADSIAKIRDAATAAGPGVASLVGHLLDLYQAGGLNADELRQVVEFFSEFDKGVLSSSTSVKVAAERLANLAGQSKITGESLRQFNTATNASAGLEAQKAALARLVELQPKAAQAAGLAADAALDLGADAKTAAAGVDTLTAAMQKGVDEAETFAQKYAAAASAAAAPAKARINAESSLLRVLDAKDRLDELNDPKKQAREQSDAIDRVRDASDSLADAIERRREAQEQLDRLTKRSAVAGSVPLLQEITQAADTAVKDAETQLQGAIARFGAGSNEAVAAQKVLDAATGRRAESLSLLDRGLAESAQANQAAVRSAQRDLDQANRGIEDAMKGKRDAESDYAVTLSDSAAKARDRRQAELDYESAQIDASEANALLTGMIQDGIDPTKALADILGQVGPNAEAAATELGKVGGNLGTLAGIVGPLIALVNGVGAGGGFLSGAITGAMQNASALGGGGGFGQLFGGGTTTPTTASTARPTPTAPEWKPNTGTPKPPYLIPAGFNAWTDARSGANWRWDGRRWQRFADGGVVPGVGNRDTEPALLTPGEFVMTRAAVQRLGVETLTRLNKGVARYATGGLVRGPGAVPTVSLGAPSPQDRAPARTVEVKPTINITSTEPKQAADETVRRMRRATFLAGVR